MAANFPGPYTLKIFHENDAASYGPLMHVQQFNVDIDGDPPIGTDFDDIDVKARVVANHPLSTVVSEWIGELMPLYSASDTTWTHAELWKNVAESFESTYVSADALAIAATGAGQNHPAAEVIATFRTYEGNMMRVHLLEPLALFAVTKGYADLSADEADVVDYVIDDTSTFFLARDTSYPALFLNWLQGQNEAIFKKRFRP